MVQAFYSASLFHESPDGALITEASQLRIGPGENMPEAIVVVFRDGAREDYEFIGPEWSEPGNPDSYEVAGWKYRSPVGHRLVIVND
jgi:hypothetical protein